MDEYWKTLGVRPGSQDKDELKKTYRRLALKHHPDRGGNEEQFKQINEAYEVLTGKRRIKRRPPPPPPRRPRPPPKPRWVHPPKPKRKVEYTYDSYDTCRSCGGQGRWKEHCNKCFGTGNVVGGDTGNSTVVESCRGCKIITCKECEGNGRIYLGKKKGVRWV